MFNKNIVKIILSVLGIVFTGINIYMLMKAIKHIGENNPMLIIFLFIQIMITITLINGWERIKGDLKDV